jgi:hypothetical protein
MNWSNQCESFTHSLIHLFNECNNLGGLTVFNRGSRRERKVTV